MKEGRNVILVIGIMLVLVLMPFASANIFSDFYAKVTGKAIKLCDIDDPNCNENIREDPCLDSDYGKDYFVKGVLTTSSGYKKYDQCSGDTLYEYYCLDSIKDTYTTYKCPNGCENGACIQEELSSYQCTDSDNGVDYSVKGTVTGTKDGVSFTKTDKCSDTTAGRALDYHCNEGLVSGYAVSFEDCQYGCNDGVCLEKPVIGDSCTDSDGDNLDVKGSVTGYSNGEDYTYFDYCIDDNSRVNEYVCKGTEVWGIANDCEFGCSDGVCLEKPVNDDSCFDSDGGKDAFTKGHVIILVDGVERKKLDYCNPSTGKLVERVCDNGNLKNVPLTCEFGCGDGVCLEEEVPVSFCEDDVCILYEGSPINDGVSYAELMYVSADRVKLKLKLKETMEMIETDSLAEGDIFTIVEEDHIIVNINIMNIMYNAQEGYTNSVKFQILEEEKVEDVFESGLIEESVLCKVENSEGTCEFNGVEYKISKKGCNMYSDVVISFEDEEKELRLYEAAEDEYDKFKELSSEIFVRNRGSPCGVDILTLEFVRVNSEDGKFDFEETPVSCEVVDEVVVGTTQIKLTEGDEFRALGLKSFTLGHGEDYEEFEFEYLGQDIKDVSVLNPEQYDYFRINDFKFYGEEDSRNYVVFDKKRKYLDVCSDLSFTGSLNYFCNGTEVDYNVVPCPNGCDADTGLCSEEESPYTIGEYNDKLMILGMKGFFNYLEENGCGSLFEKSDKGLVALDEFYLKYDLEGEDDSIDFELRDGIPYVDSEYGWVTKGDSLWKGSVIEEINFVSKGSSENSLVAKINGAFNACDGNRVNLAVCEFGEIAYKPQRCEYGCSDGACYVPGKNEECNGCLVDEKCFNFGYRKGDNFCSEAFGFTGQFTEGSSCENNFECDSNVCVGGKCISQSFWEAILEWFEKTFG